MTVLDRAALALFHKIDPERAHGLALRALRIGLGPRKGPVTSPRLATKLAGLELPNPIGLAAGFDKNAEAIAPLHRAGFGFIEVGALTPRPQPGNPRPRLFRLTENAAAINRFGFNNQGMAAARPRLKVRRTGITGLNLGANKDSSDRAADYATVLTRLGPFVDFATVNVSSPNTEKLRDLQGTAALSALLSGVMDARAALATPIPVFLKIAPDLSSDEIAGIAEVANTSGIQGIIATNTTLSRDGLDRRWQTEAGGLSGQPLFESSTRVLAQLTTKTDLPVIGVGGVGSAAQALTKIEAGASAVQLYTALVYEGIGLVPRITAELDTLLGGRTVAEAKGTKRGDWL